MAAGSGCWERALYDALCRSSNAIDFELQAYKAYPEQRLVITPLTGQIADSFGVALLNDEKKRVAYWAQISLLYPIAPGSLPTGHFLFRRARADFASSRGLDGALVNHWLPRFNLLYSRDGLGWHTYLTKISGAATRGQSIYRIAGGVLEAIDSDDAIEQNEDITELLHTDHLGLCLVSADRIPEGSKAMIDLDQIASIEATWRRSR